MKPRQIRRDVSSRSNRGADDRHGLGRLTRLRGHLKPEGAQQPFSNEWSRSGGPRKIGRGQRRSMLIWSAGFAAAALLVIVSFAVLWVRSHRNAGVVTDAGRSPANERIASRFASPSENEALSQVKQVLANRDAAAVEALVRCGEAAPAEVVEFMAGLEKREGRIERVSWLGSMDVDGMLIEGVLVVCAGKDAPTERIAFLVPDEMGIWKMDFEAFARSSKPGWSELLEKRVDHARVRVLLAKDHYFNGPFKDESQWVSYAMAAPEATKWLPEDGGFLRGYCRKESPQAKAMAQMFLRGATVRRATVEIQRTEGAEERQFEITRVLAEEWVLPPQPFDEEFK